MIHLIFLYDSVAQDRQINTPLSSEHVFGILASFCSELDNFISLLRPKHHWPGTRNRNYF